MPLQSSAICYTANCKDHSVSVVDTNTWQVVNTIGVGKNPRELVWESTHKRVFVSNCGDHTISCISMIDDTVRSIPMTGEPRGIALTHDGKLLYVVLKNEDNIAIIDTEDFSLKEVKPVGKGPRNIVLKDLGYITSNNEENTVSLGNATFPVPSKPYGLYLDHNTLYVTSIGDNCIAVIDLINERQLYKIPIGRHPTALVRHPTKPLLYCTALDDHKICVVNLNDMSIQEEIPVGNNPFGLAISTNGQYLVTTNNGDNTLSVIDTDENLVVYCLRLGDDPHGVLWVDDSADD